MIVSQTSVSYTHLDVYKRQQFEQPPGLDVGAFAVDVDDMHEQSRRRDAQILRAELAGRRLAGDFCDESFERVEHGLMNHARRHVVQRISKGTARPFSPWRRRARRPPPWSAGFDRARRR